MEPGSRRTESRILGTIKNISENIYHLKYLYFKEERSQNNDLRFHFTNQKKKTKVTQLTERRKQRRKRKMQENRKS